jgi:hypothetical protein
MLPLTADLADVLQSGAEGFDKVAVLDSRRHGLGEVKKGVNRPGF